MKNQIFLLLALAVLMASCKTQNLFEQTRHQREAAQAAADTVFRFNPHYQYTLRKDDKVSISVWGQDELSVGSEYGIYNSNEVYGKWLLVDLYGNVVLPKFGTFHVAGYTLPQLKDTLQNLYRKWIVKPVVDVKVLNKFITVMGEVRNPTAVQVDKDHNTLLDLISRTGGFEFYADLKRIKVLRQEGENVRVTNLDLTRAEEYLSKNIQLHPGDVVIVPSKHYKTFDKRISTIIPFTSTMTAAAILIGTF
ncbi:polysaccharide biosynthesis/export family protein [Chryseolinea lacunae]|uniref:Polysaccharide export protein n=1 Tax=Chryseolinea lacunae TaxID=2801331 RepID=A0ABS1L5N6_9BACT|nr:polysaccharide biosynthesis/export family protein [Chryseolinea lacunae]MBL0745836.1 polysaccharide export protein [Chryseolinea lacunae]